MPKPLVAAFKFMKKLSRKCYYFKANTDPELGSYKVERHRDGAFSCNCQGFRYGMARLTQKLATGGISPEEFAEKTKVVCKHIKQAHEWEK